LTYICGGLLIGQLTQHGTDRTLSMAIGTGDVVFNPVRPLKPEQVGQATPEGLHRDGVTFIASMMIKRNNLIDGITSITDAKKKPIRNI